MLSNVITGGRFERKELNGVEQLKRMDAELALERADQGRPR
jgi:hypothetical protein